MELNLPEHLDAPQDNFPFPAPFILSSVERDWCRYQPNRNAAIVFVKRGHLEENLKTFAREIGMGDAERKNFLDWWCCPNGSEIRAEGDPYFNLRYRAENWMNKTKHVNQPQQKSRVQKYAESAEQFYRNIQAKAVFGADTEGQGRGYADTPDEQ